MTAEAGFESACTFTVFLPFEILKGPILTVLKFDQLPVSATVNDCRLAPASTATTLPSDFGSQA
jgi:hypothetical protein